MLIVHFEADKENEEGHYFVQTGVSKEATHEDSVLKKVDDNQRCEESEVYDGIVSVQRSLYESIKFS